MSSRAMGREGGERREGGRRREGGGRRKEGERAEKKKMRGEEWRRRRRGKE